MDNLKLIDGFDDYYISPDGTIYSTKYSKRYNHEGKLRLLKPRTHPSGYLYAGLFKGVGGSKQRLWRRVHRLVVETFIGPIADGLEVNHKDLNKHNNNVSNLEVVTRRENIIHFHKFKNGN
jgi:hypothetical protein